jgi:hypothetical protein
MLRIVALTPSPSPVARERGNVVRKAGCARIAEDR